MARRSPSVLDRVVERMAKLSPPRHRELVRGLLAELDSITDSAERRRFALGAMAALARLALSGYSRAAVHALTRLGNVGVLESRAQHGGLPMSTLRIGDLLRRLTFAFAFSLASLTLLLLGNYARQVIPRLSEAGASASATIEVVLLGLPHTLALTVPMGVFVAVSWVFCRLGKEGVLTSARRQASGVRRLIGPVLGASAFVAMLTLVSNTYVLPRTNARIVAVLEGAPRESARTMTVAELRSAARSARSAFGSDPAAAVYEVEIHKKFALAAASLFLALAAAATAIRFPHGGVRLMLGTSAIVFPGYWAALVAGETLADEQVISPFLAMWMANAFLLAIVAFFAWQPGRHDPAPPAETLAI